MLKGTVENMSFVKGRLFSLCICVTLWSLGRSDSRDNEVSINNEETIHADNNLGNNEIADFNLNVNFIYYSREVDKGSYISPMNSSKHFKELFKPALDTKIIVHGWMGNKESVPVKHTAEEYLKVRDLNVIAVDWSSDASWKVYPISAMQVSTIGATVAVLIDRLVEHGATSLKQIHLIGHSLGAHVMGHAGSFVKGGKVARITGLDPAKPGFEFVVSESSRLDPSDAEFVDVIHSAAGAAGFYNPLGHADFYPNGGTPPQPGCFDISDPLKLIGCSHGRSYLFFAESIENPQAFKAVECDSWSNFKSGQCDNNASALMGDSTPPDTRGVFYLETNAEYPYSKL